jgi:hypothetical protein
MESVASLEELEIALTQRMRSMGTIHVPVEELNKMRHNLSSNGETPFEYLFEERDLRDTETTTPDT